MVITESSLARRIVHIPLDVLRESSRMFLQQAVENQDPFAYGHLVERLGLSPESDSETFLFDRYQLERDSHPALFASDGHFQETVPHALKTREERRGTFIASTVGGYRRAIPDLAQRLKRELPVGYSRWKKPELKSLYWDLRHDAERRRLM